MVRKESNSYPFSKIPNVKISKTLMWIIDSGTSSNMRFLISVFTIIHDINTFFVQMGKKDTVKLDRTGDIEISTTVNGKN